jgi:hypothetical protein
MESAIPNGLPGKTFSFSAVFVSAADALIASNAQATATK